MKTFTLTLLIVLSLSFLPHGANAAVLKRVTSQSLADGKDVVSILFQGRSKPKIFSLKGNSPRLVFDFPDARYLGPALLAVNGTVVKAVRVANHQNPLKTRVVFDLIPGHDVAYDQEFLQDKETLRITISDKKMTPSAHSAPEQTAATPATQILVPVEPAVKAAEPVVKTAEPAVKPVVPAAQPSAPEQTAATPAIMEQTLVPAEPVVKPAERAAKPAAPVVKKPAIKAAEPAAKSAAPAAKPAAPAVKTETKTAPPRKTVPPSEPQAEPAATAAKSAETTPSSVAPRLLTAKPPAEASGSTAPEKITLPVAARMVGYSLSTQPTGGDVLRLQLDGYASPTITAREGHKPQIVCYFPQMRLVVDKGLSQPPPGKFVQKVAVSAQKDPVGVEVVLDLENGYDYNVQQVFVKDESAFLLIVSVINH
ncbi:MAG: AMIN domain-containing protein [Desulfobulbaceae bacterium]|nr:AMIN domain-containing protein [Desulfobulbaceae bacterium]